MKRAWFIAVAALVPALAAAADFSGTWKLDNTFNGSVSVIHCTLVQSGDALSGSCKPDLPGMEASKLTGTVKGSTAQWGYDLVFNGRPARVDYARRSSSVCASSAAIIASPIPKNASRAATRCTMPSSTRRRANRRARTCAS